MGESATAFNLKVTSYYQKMKHITLIIVLILAKNSFGQVLNYTKSIDLNKDGIEETIKLFDEYNGEFEKTEFTIFQLITEVDTLEIRQEDVFVEQKEIYKNADRNIDNRLGIIYENGSTYLWLTCYQYGCCINRTVILEFDGKKLHEIFNKEFEFKKIEKIENQRYFIGQSFLTEPLGNEFFFLANYQPTDYLQVSNYFKLNEEISARKALEEHKTIEKDIDPYNCEELCLRIYEQDCFLLSPQKANELMEREFGITSLIKIPKEYFDHYPKEKLKIIRNEIFAYYGYNFQSPDLLKYFESKSWYNPTDISSESVFKKLTEIEKFNIKMLKELEE